MHTERFASYRKPLTAAARCLLTLACAALLAACASAPPPPAAATPTRAERVQAALKAMNFEQTDDGWQLSLPAPLVFPFDSDVVSDEARRNLMRIAAELRQLGIDQLKVIGHTDNVGTRDYNLALSKRRAETVASVISEGGFPAERIEARGLGFGAPVADNATAEGRARNRRVVIIVQLSGLPA